MERREDPRPETGLIERRGLDATGALDVPRDPTNVVLYNLYDQPGAPGNSLWAGYSGAAFAQLKELKAGDEVFVETENGGRYRYVVRSSTRYPAATIPLGEIARPKDRPREKEWLTMMTSGRVEPNGEHVDYIVVVSERTD